MKCFMHGGSIRLSHEGGAPNATYGGSTFVPGHWSVAVPVIA